MSSDDIKKWKGLWKSNAEIFSSEEKKVGDALCSAGQTALFSKWRGAGQKDQEKRSLIQQAQIVQENYPGGIKEYGKTMKKKLKGVSKSQYAGFTPALPTGGMEITDSDEDFQKKALLEMQGIENAANLAFVLMAGGSGERLEFNSKITLPVNISTENTLLEHFIEQILAIQNTVNAKGTNNGSVMLPLAIMTSEDTHNPVVQLLEEHNYFGMQKGQITLLQQYKVPCVKDTTGAFVVDAKDPFSLETKPHGSGDVHSLLFKAGVLEGWLHNGCKWIVFFEDSNALAFNGIFGTLGAAMQEQWSVAHVCTPRQNAAEEVGVLCKMTNKKRPDDSFTGVVEHYNLPELLKASKCKETNFPANTNTVLFDAVAYNQAISENQGLLPEYINVSWKDREKGLFKSFARLECNMADFSRFIEGTVSYVSFPRWMVYAPIVNATFEAREIQKSGMSPNCPSSAEFAQYAHNRNILRKVGVKVDEQKDIGLQGITVANGARIVLSPSFGITATNIQSKFQPSSEGSIFISPGSTLILEGDGITVSGLHLEGTLIVRAAPGARVHIDNLVVKNEGWTIVPIKEPKKKPKKPKYSPQLLMRGFYIKKVDDFVVTYDKPGCYELFRQTQAGRPVVVESENEEGEE